MLEILQSIHLTRKKSAGIVIAIVIIGALFEIWTLNRLATFGDQIAKFEQASLDLKLENQILENEIAMRSAFQAVNSESSQLGFKRISQIDFIRPSTVALNQ
jgi:hypothetical protein